MNTGARRMETAADSDSDSLESLGFDGAAGAEIRVEDKVNSEAGALYPARAAGELDMGWQGRHQAF